jgi:hypothetical protein
LCVFAIRDVKMRCFESLSKRAFHGINQSALW